MITPSRLQVAPRLFEASHRVRGGPPEISIFLSFPPAKNPRKRLSGDQNGDDAPSVAASASGANVSRERTHKTNLPSLFAATKAIRRPSGETATGAVVPGVVVPNPAKFPGGET